MDFLVVFIQTYMEFHIMHGFHCISLTEGKVLQSIGIQHFAVEVRILTPHQVLIY